MNLILDYITSFLIKLKFRLIFYSCFSLDYKRIYLSSFIELYFYFDKGSIFFYTLFCIYFEFVFDTKSNLSEKGLLDETIFVAIYYSVLDFYCYFLCYYFFISIVENKFGFYYWSIWFSFLSYIYAFIDSETILDWDCI